MMKRAFLLLATSAIALAQIPQVPEVPPPAQEQPDVKLPNGKSQREEILKADYKNNLRDAAKMSRLTQEVQRDLDRNGHDAVSVQTLKRLDEIDKLARSIRERLRH